MSHAYRVLARKYRPAVFEELIGQTALVRILSNAIKTNRLPHAFMLSGVRGVGKTTTARLLARSLNCIGPNGQEGPTLSPCGKCDSCQKIARDGHVDVIEMDAASRTGVDDIRELIEGVHYKPISARYKIYIIDEVHMLSKHAFNALLKTLEEPPVHAKFIFATTEIRRVPITILSRCMRFDLKMVDCVTLSQHLLHIANLEKINLDSKAAYLLAQAAQGSVRDALSLLDQAIVYNENHIKASDIEEMLGILDRNGLYALVEALFKGDVQKILALAQKAYQEGIEPLLLLQDLQYIIHLLSRGKTDSDFWKSPELTEIDREKGQIVADQYDMPLFMRAWQMILKGIQELPYASNSYIALEMILLRLAYVANLPTPQEMVTFLEEKSAKEETSAPEITPNIQNFQDVISLCQHHKEMLLSTHLTDHVVLIEFTPYHIKLSLRQGAPKDLAFKLQQFLKTHTHEHWAIEIIDTQTGSTLYELDQKRKEKELKEIDAIPLVAKIKEAFPDAKISSIENLKSS